MKKLSFVFLFVLLLLTGCGTAEVKLDADGSGEITYKIPYDDSFYTAEEVKEEFEDIVQEGNEEAGKKVLALKSFKDKDGVATIVMTFKNGTHMVGGEDSFLQASVEDMMRFRPSALEELKDLDGKAIDLEDKKVKDYTYLEISGLELEKFILTVPGEVKYVSSGVKLKDKKDDTITTEKSSFVVVYEEQGGFNFFGIFVALLVVVMLFFLFKKGVFNKFKRKNKPAVEQAQRLDGGTSQDA